jgi:hypothetical protein
MSIFRDEFGPWYMAMFLLLFFGKVWGWLCDGRIEFLEQQQPRNPRLFHVRLCAALALYIIGAGSMLFYCLDEVIYEARPGVMIMFVFEWAIICVSILSTFSKYGLWAYERRVLIQQESTRRAELRVETPDLNADDVDVNELDLPGWEAKGSWVFTLDIAIDFLKLIAYIAFFCVLTIFYGIPIYIIRDLYMTMRSFIRRITDYIKYENATRDMHALYPDATPEELSTDNTCIVCREEMHPWIGNNPIAQADDAQPRATSERNRPKKLPCAHILHFHCLRSWLERQQACPICRRSVLRPLDRGIAAANQPQQGQGANAQPGAAEQPRDGGAAPNRPGFNFQFGNFRFQLGAGVQVNNPAAANPPAPPPPPPPPPVAAAPTPLVLPQQPEANILAPTPTQPAPTIPATQTPQPAQAGPSTQSTNPNAHSLFDLPNIDEAFPSLSASQPLIRHHVLHTQLNAMEAYLWQELAHAQIGIDRVNQLRQLQSELTRSRLAMTNHVTTTLPPNHLLNGPLVLEATQDPSASLVLPGNNSNTMNTVIRLPPGWTSVPLRAASQARTEEAAGENQSTEYRTPTIPEQPTTNAGFPNVAEMMREAHQQAHQQAFHMIPGQGAHQNPAMRPQQPPPGQTPSLFNAAPNSPLAIPQNGGFLNHAQNPVANAPAMFSNIADMMRQAQQQGTYIHQNQTVQIPLPAQPDGANNTHVPGTHTPGTHTPQGFPDLAEMMRQAQEHSRQWGQNPPGSDTQNAQNNGDQHNIFSTLMQQMQQRINQDIRTAGPARGSRPPSTSPSRNFQAHPPGPASQTSSGRQSPSVALNGAMVNPPGQPSVSTPQNGAAPSPLRHSESHATSSTTTSTTTNQNPSNTFSTSHTFSSGQGPTVTSSWSFDNIPTDTEGWSLPTNAEASSVPSHQTGNEDRNNEETSRESSRGRPRPATVEDVPEEDID